MYNLLFYNANSKKPWCSVKHHYNNKLVLWGAFNHLIFYNHVWSLAQPFCNQLFFCGTIQNSAFFFLLSLPQSVWNMLLQSNSEEANIYKDKWPRWGQSLYTDLALISSECMSRDINKLSPTVFISGLQYVSTFLQWDLWVRLDKCMYNQTLL